MTPRIKAFKEQRSPLPEPVGDVLQRLATRPSEITVSGPSLNVVITEAHRLGAFIPSMTADRASYGLRLDWSGSLNDAGDDGERKDLQVPVQGLEPAANELQSTRLAPIATPASFSEPEPQPDPLASALERIRAGAERNRRDRQLQRRFRKVNV